MKINCTSGFFFIEETRPGEVSDFIQITDLAIVPYKNGYTFEFLSEAPDYSIAGGTYLGAVASKTFAGDPSDIFRENFLIYDFNKNLVLPLATVFQPVALTKAGRYYVSDGLILPGSLTSTGERINSYVSHFLFDSMKFKYPWIDS